MQRQWKAVAPTMMLACNNQSGFAATAEATANDLYPALGAGVQYILKPKEGIVVNLEYAQGKDSNYGVYLKMGYAY